MKKAASNNLENDGIVVPKPRENFMPATSHDLDHPNLVNPYTGIFWNVSKQAKFLILKSARIEYVKAGTVLYEQDTPSDLHGIYFVLAGDFEVSHVSESGKRIIVATGDDIIAFGDTEFLLKDTPNIVTRWGMIGRTKAQVKCKENGRLLCISPPENLFAGREFQVALNLSRILAIKLLRRNESLEKKMAGVAHLRIARNIAGIIEANKSKIVKDKSGKNDILQVEKIIQANIAAQVNAVLSATTEFKIRVKKVYGDEFSWEDDTLIVSGNLLKEILNKKSDFLSKIKYT